MLDASRGNETAAVEKISKLQEEKKILQVSINQHHIPIIVDTYRSE